MPDPVVARLSVERGQKLVQANPDEIAKFIERSVTRIPEGQLKERARGRMRAGLLVEPAEDDTAAIAEVWRKCEAASVTPSQQAFDQKFDEGHAEFLYQLVCKDTRNGNAVVTGIIRNWISDAIDRREFSIRLARGLLGMDGTACPGAKDLDQRDKDRLRKLAPASSPAPAPAPI